MKDDKSKKKNIYKKLKQSNNIIQITYFILKDIYLS